MRPLLSVWGEGQPAGDLTKPEWRAELTRIIGFWVTEMGLSGFMLDDPSAYLAAKNQDLNTRNDTQVSAYVREVIVEPAHKLGAAVFGEMYNFQRPTTAKMLDGGRNTDMPDGTLGFPGKLHEIVVSGDATGLEPLLVETVDRWVGWCGTPRTQPDVRGNESIAGQKAAITALLTGYYLMRAGSKYPCHVDYDAKTPGDAWPGGCFGAWNGSAAVAPTLKSIPSAPALSPGTPRESLRLAPSSGPGAYAALKKSRGEHSGGAVVVVNVANRPATIEIDLTGSRISRPQATADIILGGAGPAIGEDPTWRVSLPAHGWAAFGVKLDADFPPATSLKTDDGDTPNTLRDFGYYYAMQSNNTVPAVTLGHTTTTFADPASFPEGVAALAAANISVVIACSGLFIDPANQTALVKNWAQKWQAYWALVEPHASLILAFYPVDEPSPGLIASGAYAILVKAIKESAPHIPIAAVVTPSAVKGIEYGAYSLPPEVDWIGGDDYGCWGEKECQVHGHCCWENRTMPHNLAVLRNYTAKRGGKMVVIPDGVAFPTLVQRKHGQKAMPTAAQQAVRASRDRNYYEWCKAEELCVSMWVFLWRSVHTSTGWLTGVEDQREVMLPALVEMGTAIKQR
jgi:hypothetical protein